MSKRKLNFYINDALSEMVNLIPRDEVLSDILRELLTDYLKQRFGGSAEVSQEL